jgi:hypothetical protein
MSWGTCYSGSNNIHMGFPALMSDGRLYANWDAACGMNNALKAKEGIKNNYEYRQYLIKNGSQVMHQNAMAACDNCCACKENYNKTPRVNDKYIFKSCSDKTVPFGYEHSDLKNMYLTSQDLASRLAAPILTQSDYLAKGIPNYN